MEVIGQIHAMATLPQGKQTPGGLRAGLDTIEQKTSLAPAGNRTSDHSPSTELSRLLRDNFFVIILTYTYLAGVTYMFIFAAVPRVMLLGSIACTCRRGE